MTKTREIGIQATNATQPPLGPDQYGNCVHMRIWGHADSFRSVCGKFRVPGFLLTDRPDQVTCPDCRREWDAFNAEEI